MSRRPDDVVHEPSDAEDGTSNQVFLRGRLAAEPLMRELPSGDVLAMFRLTVDAPAR